MINQIDINSYLALAQKIFAVLGSIIYFIFSLVVVKQVTSMSQNVKDKFNGILIVFSFLHLIFAIFLVIMTLLVL